MNNMNIIIESIKKVFDISEENVSSLKDMFNNIDANCIYEKFRREHNEQKYSKEEITSKLDLLNSLTEIILENPSMESVDKKSRKDLLLNLYRVLASLYEQLLLDKSCKDSNKNIYTLTMYSMFSYMYGG